MSFYLNLSSKDSADVHPQNYGGDFQVELQTPLHFHEHDRWEVALAEMTYDAQGFPNIPPEYSQIKFQALNRHSVYDATEMDLSITCFLRVVRYQSFKAEPWIESDNEKVLQKRRLNKYVLPKKCYTWQGFKDALKALGEVTSETYISYAINLTDTQLELKYSTAAYEAKWVFSKDLVKLLSLEKDTVEVSYARTSFLTGTLQVNYTKPSMPSEGVIFPASSNHPFYIEIKDHARFNIPHSNYTIQELAKNFPLLTSHGGFAHRMRLTFEYTETDESFQWELKVQTFEAIDFALHFSWAFLYHLGAPVDNFWAYISTKAATPPTAIRKGTVRKFHTDENMHINFINLPYNYYPNTQAFLDGLNKCIMEMADFMCDAKAQEQPLFTLEKSTALEAIHDSKKVGKCIFKPHPLFKFTLHPFILNVLKLKDTAKEQIGSSLAILPSATREFFYLYTNIIASHTYSGAINMLRVINNNTSLPNEKIMISFQHLYYHPLTQFFIPNIQIRITDNHTDLILPFTKEVTCLLHFRRCSNNNNNNIHLV
jgi:hypothetical protein